MYKPKNGKNKQQVLGETCKHSNLTLLSLPELVLWLLKSCEYMYASWTNLAHASLLLTGDYSHVLKY